MEIKEGKLTARSFDRHDFVLTKEEESGVKEFGIISFNLGEESLILDIKKPYFVTFTRQDLKDLDSIFERIENEA